MSRQRWYSGPPPSIGWWPASMQKDANYWRWWDGSEWSIAAHCHCTAEEAAERAKTKTSYPCQVYWTNP